MLDLGRATTKRDCGNGALCWSKRDKGNMSFWEVFGAKGLSLWVGASIVLLSRGSNLLSGTLFGSGVEKYASLNPKSEWFGVKESPTKVLSHALCCTEKRCG